MGNPPGENTRYVFRPCPPHCSDFFVLHSIAETAAFALRYLLFFPPHFVWMWKKKKKEPQRRLRGREAARAAYTCCATDLQRRGRVVGGPRRYGARLWTASRPSSTSAHAHGDPTSFNSWQIQNRISFTISELRTLARQDDFFSFPAAEDFSSPSARCQSDAPSQSELSLFLILFQIYLCIWKKKKKHKTKKGKKKKGNPFLLGQIWKARCPLRTTALPVCSHIKGRCLRSETRGAEGSATLSWNLIKPVEDRGGWLQNGMTHSGRLLFSYLFK